MFSTLNLVKGHYQVEMFPDDILKTTISTPFGLFEFLLMFWLTQRQINLSADDGQRFVGSALDHATQRQHLGKVLHSLRENRLTIDPLKSFFGQE